MTSARWQEIKRVLDLVEDASPDARMGVLTVACAGDGDLRREVESLLSFEGKAAVLDRAARAMEVHLAQENTGQISGPTRAFRLAAGARLGPYEILTPLGAGGMGEVYQARDTRLGRTVALKILLGGLVSRNDFQRFEREARLWSRLSHAHICTLFDIGCQEELPFLVMEFVAGETAAICLKRGPLAPDEVLRCAAQVASALSHAHRNGIMHRDLKPANIMLTREGAKVLDFGIAKTIEADSGGLADLTGPGGWVGTLAYTAPEVLNMQKVDARLDIYSFGVVLYEMLCGEHPYAGLHGDMLAAAILRGKPTPLRLRRPELPPGLCFVAERAMAVYAEDRYRSSEDLLHAIQHSNEPGAAPGASRLPVIAVAEFQNIAEDPEVGWLGMGLAETIGADLRRNPEIRVAAPERVKEAVKRFGLQDARLGDALHADWVVCGGFQRAGPTIRITPRVTCVASGEVFGTGKIDGRWEELFEVQDRAVLEIQRVLSVTSVSRSASSSETLIEAYRQYALGREKSRSFERKALDEAYQHFENAVRLDSKYAAAYCALGTAHQFRFIRSGDPKDLASAKEYLERALALDPESGEPYGALCYVYMRQHDAQRAITAGQRAVKHQPDLYLSHYYLGAAYWVFARLDPSYSQRSVNHFSDAGRTDPRYEPTWFVLACNALRAGDYGQTQQYADRLSWLQQAGRGSGGWFGPHIVLGELNLRRQQPGSALEILGTAQEAFGDRDHVYREPILALCACARSEAHLRLGRTEESLREIRHAWRRVSEFPLMLGHLRVKLRTLAGMAAVYASTGDRTRAAHLLDEAGGVFEQVKSQPGSLVFCAGTEDLAYVMAKASMVAGQTDAALGWLETAYQWGWRDIACLEADPLFSGFRRLDRFRDLKGRLQALAPVSWPPNPIHEG
jgi:serine/threonine-protein kinase